MRARLSAIWNRFGATWRLGSLHHEHAEARASERERRALVTGIASATARLAGIGTSLITVPITLSYLGTERFGLWMAISSILGMVRFADFGLGNGVMNRVAGSHGRNDIRGIRAAISTGFGVLGLIAIVLIAAFAAMHRLVDWGRLFNVHSPIAAQEAGPAMFVFASCFALNIPAGLVQRTQLGLQEGFFSSLWQLAGSVAGLLGVLIVVHFHGGLPWLLSALCGAPLLMSLLNAAVFFGWSHGELRPSLRCVSRTALVDISRLGGVFFVLQVVVGATFYSDGFLIARLLDADAVTQYVIPQRMFLLISVLLSMFTAPLWPAYAEALSRGDTDWVRATLFKSMKTALTIAACASGLLLISAPLLLRLWVGHAVYAPIALLAGMALWTLFDVGGNALAMFLNGASIVRFQVVVASAFGIGCVAAKIFAVRRFGVTALPWATMVAYSLCHVLPCIVVVPGLLAGLHTRTERRSQPLSVAETNV